MLARWIFYSHNIYLFIFIRGVGEWGGAGLHGRSVPVVRFQSWMECFCHNIALEGTLVPLTPDVVLVSMIS